MYLPLTGYKDRNSFEDDMSIESIGPSIDPRIVQAPDGAHKAQQENRETDKPEVSKPPPPQELSDEKKEAAVEGFYSAGSMNTQDFLILKTQSADKEFEVLDEVIANMKENIEEVGEAMEAMAKLAEKTSKQRVGIQLLEKTLEAIEKYSANE